MRITLVGLLSAVVVAAACKPAPQATPVDTAADVAAIGKLRDAYVAAWKAGDGATLSSYFTADGMEMENNIPTAKGPEGVKATVAGMTQQMTPSELTLTSEKVEVSGDMAYDRGTFHLTMMPKAAGATPMSDSGRYLVIIRKQADGSWKLAEVMGNSATPMAPPPAAPKGK